MQYVYDTWTEIDRMCYHWHKFSECEVIVCHFTHSLIELIDFIYTAEQNESRATAAADECRGAG